LAFDKRTAKMERLVLTCTGASVGSLWVPPLQLRLGELLCFHMPGMPWSPDQNHLVAALAGLKPVAGLEPRGHIAWVEPPSAPKGLLQMLIKHPRAADWLRQNGGLSRDASAAIVARLDPIVDGRIAKNRIGSVPWEGRMLLALEAAWARNPDAIVFTTVGAAGLPALTIFKAIAPRLSNCAAIHLCYAQASGAGMEHTCFPGARCIPLTVATTAKQAS
jgi:hypothetical protein